MKFHNGCWLLKEGFAGFYPKQVYETRLTEREAKLFLPTTAIEKKGDTLGGVCLTMRVTAPLPEMLRVQIWHYRGTAKKDPPLNWSCRRKVSRWRQRRTGTPSRSVAGA